MNRPDACVVPVDRTLIEALRARLQADSGQPVDLLETHISWILLSGSLAYKLKKPVHLPFLDFTTIESRRQDCELELRLNQRYAPSLYLSVLPVCGSPQSPYLDAADGFGEPIDYAVCMRRFPGGALLSEQLAAGTLSAAKIERLAQRLADAHRKAPVTAPASPFGTSERVLKSVLEVLDQLEIVSDSEAIPSLRRWVLEEAQVLAPVWPARRAAGAVRGCHGDLHLANAVEFEGEVLAFDCIEFDPALRWIDVMNDLAFLTMDLRAHGRIDLTFRALDAYLQHSGDYAGLQVLRFYEVYRALVRTLVASLRERGRDAPGPASDPDYAGCAQRLTQSSADAPRLMITHGFSGSGKSVLAGRLLEHAGAIRMRSDVERKRLFGLSALQRPADVDLDAGIYSPEATRRTFERLAACARAALLAGYPVIVDAAFLRRHERQQFRALAAESGVPFTILDCRADTTVLRQRVAERGAAGTDASDADVSVLDQQLQWNEPLDADEQVLAIEAATDAPVDTAALCTCWLAAT
ncbi:MAG: AAA family ATPase [Burkholderiaceae bacterium]|nr:AAA family ATPase [Burkholderiaceae bacterium]